MPTSTLPAVTATAAPAAAEAEAYPNAELLVDAAWLAEHLEDEGLRIIDMRAPEAYADGHVPGAVNLPVGVIVDTVDGVPFEVDRDMLQQALGQIGLTREAPVVIYDDLGMMDAARLFWSLEFAGHERAAVLDGGWDAWVAEGHPVTQDEPTVEPTVYEAQFAEARLVSAEEVLSLLDEPDVVILDARSPQEYTGEVALAERGGHIPSAVNLPWLEVLTGGDAVYTTEPNWQAELQDEDVERLKPAEAIRAEFEQLGITPDDEVITYCQTLWRGAHAYFVLRLMGYDSVRGYDGSWAEWGNRSDLPVVTGSEPGQAPEAEGNRDDV